MKIWGNIMVALAIAGLAGCGQAGRGGAGVVHVDVTDAGFTPPLTRLHKGRPTVVVFKRTTDQTCGTDVVFPSLHRGYDLPLNKEVRVELSAADIGDTLKFNCSMDMLHGTFVAN